MSNTPRTNVATAATQDAQAIVASCCAAFDCRPSELLGMIRDLKGRDMKGQPAPTGCGAIFKLPEGWSCDCERAHPAPCAKGERSDDAGGKP